MATTALTPAHARPSSRPGGLVRALGRQFALALATLLMISVVTFAANNIKSPIDVARNALGRFANPQTLVIYAHQHDLYAPVYVRYARWLGDFVQGNWGVSPVTNQPVEGTVTSRMGRTVILAGASTVLALVLGIALGASAARHPRSKRDGAIVLLSVILASLPEFVIGLVLLLVLGVDLKVLPADSTGLSFGDLGAQIKAYILPVLTLTLAILPYVTRMARSAFQETFGSDYIRAAVLRGLPRRSVIWRHAMPNAAVVLVNVIAQNLIYVLGGVIVVEAVFGVPGIGQLLVDAVGSGDVITVEAIALVTGAVFVAINFAADATILLLSPKLRARARQ
jgi:peptide/nickel transport system permease protein